MSQELIGQTLEGRYQVEARIGRGGMGDVYLARHLLLGSQIALKVLAGERAGDPTAARRFVREARSAFRVDHPNCIRVTDLGAADGVLYIAMEYLDGRTVGEELAVDGPITPGRAAHIARQIADALSHAHGLGLVHRDLKPENVMLVRREGDADFVKVLDFGLARVFDEHGDLAGTAISLSPLTRDGLVFGTPEYMSPEQASGSKAGPESDIYSLGAVLYHMVTGSVPFSGRTFTDILVRHVRDEPMPPSARRPDLGIPPAVDAIVLECLAKAATSRPPGARALSERLRALAAELGPGRSRLAPHLAASETMDLEASQVASLQQSIREEASTRDLWPVKRPSADVPTIGIEPVTTEVPVRSRRGLFIGGVLVAAALAGGAGLMFAGGAEEVVATLDAAAAPLPATLPVAALPDPAPADPAPVPDPDPTPPTSTPKKSSSQVQAEKHIRAAEAARRDGNFLLQLAQADEARQLDPKNRRAAELMGEALVKSGDSERGCRLLRGSRLHRQVGCAD